jgi:transketolase
MINRNIFDEDNVEMAATRDGFGQALLELGKENEKVVALTADLCESVKMDKFKEAFPKRFFEMGVSEQNMAGVASGMAAMGMIPFMASYAMFSPGRNWEQIRTTIAYNNQKVIIIGAHAGLSVGADGGTHQALEDIAIMRAIPNITIYSPVDSVQAYHMTKQAVKIAGPVYIRLAREKTPIIFNKENYRLIGGAEIIYTTNSDHKKVGIVTTGPITYEALQAAKIIEKENVGVTVLNLHTIKPLDENLILRFANTYKTLVVVEEAQKSGGLFGAVSEFLAEHKPTPILSVAIKNRFGQSGTSKELYKEYEISREHIAEAIRLAAHRH